MATVDFSFLSRRRWQALIGVLVLIGLYFVFRPERDPVEVITANLHDWAARIEKTAESEPDARLDSSPAVLAQQVGQIRSLVRDAFTLNAQINARGAPRQAGRDEILKWCFALRSQATELDVTLSNIQVVISPENPMLATATLHVRIHAIYAQNTYSRDFDCALSLERDQDDKKWRIDELTARALPQEQAQSQTQE